MEADEHFYSDDPSKGPSDVKTRLEGVDYFFLGNGFIQAAVQVCPGGEGTRIGLLIMDPKKPGPKRSALTLDPADGLAGTQVRIRAGEQEFLPSGEGLSSAWIDHNGIPAVRVKWQARDFQVEELFFCPDRSTPRLTRQITIKRDRHPLLEGGKHQVSQTDSEMNSGPVSLTAVTGSGDRSLKKEFPGVDGEVTTLSLCYELEVHGEETPVVKTRWQEPAPAAREARAYWQNLALCDFSHDSLNHLFTASKNQIPAVIEKSGIMDGSIWQYGLEWVRDQAMVIMGLAMAGDFETARTMLSRLFTRFVTDEGDTIDSSRKRPPAEIELDQNGQLLLALKTYVFWSRDLSLAEELWDKIRATAEFPLKACFRHEPSGLLHNQREYWERHALHGVEDGMELSYQLYVALGLHCASALAQLMGRTEEAIRWEAEGRRLRITALTHKEFGLIEAGRFIKRRKVTGEVQVETTAAVDAGLPEGIPLLEDGPHLLNPDSSSVLPIALEFLDPKGEVARNTLKDMEKLWNQCWEGGGYSRYHVTSEPDSPGPWPFASMFIARAYFEAGEHEKVWRVLNWLASAPGHCAGTWFEFYGPRPVPPYPQVGFTPWTWAELLCFFIHHLLGVRPAWQSLLLRPALLPGLNQVRASLPIGAHRLELTVRHPEKGEEKGFVVDDEFHPFTEKGLLLPYPEEDLEVEALV